MTITYGLTEDGFVKKTPDVVLSDLQAMFRATYGNDIDLGPTTTWGSEIAILAELENVHQDQLEAMYAAMFPQTASGSNLVRNCELIGVDPLAATVSKVNVIMSGSNGTTVLSGSVFATSVLGTRVITQADASIGTSFTGSVECWAQDVGPFQLASGSITTIVTPVVGLKSVYNLEDAFYVGTNLETDAQLRAHRESGLGISAGASTNAIRAGLLAVSGVTSVSINKNKTSAEVDGLPAYNMEAIVQGGTSADVAAALAEKCAATTPLSGTSVEYVIDSEGVAHPYYFSRPTDVDAYVQTRVWVKNSVQLPDNFSVLVASASINKTFEVGQDVHGSSFVPNIFAVSDSVLNVEYVKLSGSLIADPYPLTTGTPSGSDTLVISKREAVALDPSRVRVILVQVSE
jgi:uncharacterized phage protein gp47/JayE